MRDLKKIHLKYGGNPTGLTTSAERRREVLGLAQKYNFLILEGRLFDLAHLPPAIQFTHT